MTASALRTRENIDPSAIARGDRALARSVAVCIPARDEQHPLGRVVEAALAATASSGGAVGEVLVVDDGSVDATVAVAAAAGARVISGVQSRLDPRTLCDDDYIEDFLMIDRVDSGSLWFEGQVGPVAVPVEAGNIAQVGWSVNVVLGRVGTTWQILEVGNVYP